MSSEIQPNAAAGNAPQGIDVGRLEKELAANWRSAVEGEESSVTRVCVLNLIVYVAPGEDRAQLEELLDAVTEQSPGRILVLVADRGAAEATLEAYASTRCQTAPRGAAKQVCGEQVTIEAGGAAVDTAASAIEPLVVPDVPVFLWWKNIPHEEDKLFDRLVELSDRVVIDSLVFDQPHADMKRLAEIVGARRQYMLASDLNWGRLTSWRNLIASFWDVPDYRPHLDALDDLLVEYDPPDAASDEIAAHALLVAGWLAAELKWEPTGEFAREENGTARWVLQAQEGRRINVSFRPAADRHGCDGLIATLTFRTGATGAEFYVGVNEGWTKLETSAKIGDAREVGRVVSYEAKSEGRRLGRELSILSRDEVYERAVAFVGRLIEVLQKS